MLVNELKQRISHDESILSDIRAELITKLGGSILLTLIEIGGKSPDKTNPTNLCQVLEVPISTLSTQIKKLINLEYLDSSISLKSLKDSRYKSYKITSKGILLLHLLREAIHYSLEQLNDNLITD